MKNRYLFILLFLTVIKAWGQVPKTEDSLKVYLEVQPRDTNYVRALNEYSFIKVKNGDFKKANELIDEMDQLAQKLDYKQGLYYTINMRGVVEYSNRNPKKAMEYFLKAHEVIEKYNLPKERLQNSLNNIGIIYDQMGDRENATRYAVELIKYQEKHQLNPLKSWPYDQLGTNLKFYKKYKEALIYYQKGFEIEKARNDFTGMAIGENKIGAVYDDMEQYDLAESHYKKGLAYAEKVNYKMLQSELLTNLGLIYRKTKDYARSEKCLKRSMALCQEIGLRIPLKTIYHNLGDLYFFKQNYALSEKYYLDALEIAKETEQPDYLYTANLALAELYEQTEDYKQAYTYRVASEVAKDSIFKIETAQSTEEMLRKYETEKKEQEIALLNIKNEKASLVNKGLIGGSLALVMLAGLSVVYLNNRSKLRRLQESQKLRNKIASDLHDEIGSTLSSIMLISDMAQKKEGSDQRMFSKINSDSKTVMQSVDEIIWSISPVHDNLQGIMLRLREFAAPLAESGGFSFEISAGPDVGQLTLAADVRRNLYLIIKEGVNNLAKYSGATEAKVHFERQKNTLIITVQDNGRGFDPGQESVRNGLKNMKSRAEEIGARLDIRSSASGTVLALEVPF
ncbi:MAG: sensor histidine kinase [Leadbetterella sp.]|nr:sensor histidine kinase [Leadbetterella sp.]